MLLVWRVYFYIYTSDAPTYKNYMYDLLLKYEPLINLLYSLVIIYPLFDKICVKKLQKCLNLLEEIKLRDSSEREKRIFYVIVFILLLLTFCVEFIEIPIREIDGLNHFDFIIALWTSWMQTLCLLTNSIYYCILMDRLDLILQELNTHKIQKRQFKDIVKTYSKCAALISTIDEFNFFVLRNVSLHCVYDLLYGYKGCQAYWNRYVSGENDEIGALADVIGTFWNHYNVPIALYLIDLSSRLQEKVI